MMRSWPETTSSSLARNRIDSRMRPKAWFEGDFISYRGRRLRVRGSDKLGIAEVQTGVEFHCGASILRAAVNQKNQSGEWKM